jgi:omega-hydroxy-beta-dihydromenaquinone-9 sulfotransferase
LIEDFPREIRAPRAKKWRLRDREKMGELSSMSLVSQQRSPQGAQSANFNAYPWWCPRFWHGMRLGDWLDLAQRNRFRIHPLRWGMALTTTGFAVFNSTCAALQRWRYGNAIAEAPIEHPPLFILGHWRSGTTYLHELLSLDERFCSPNSYECFAPTHFLLTEWWVTRWFWWMVPNRRPMDNMAAGWLRPQEDEFALCTLGVPTPYLRMAFPNDPPPYLEFLDMEGVPEPERNRWKETLLYFAKAVTYLRNKPIVFKSPPHTGRIATLLEIFPEARFVHIARDPYELFASTLRLWKALDDVQGFQIAGDEGREAYVFAAFERMYRGYERQRHLVPPGRLHEIRYEDLTADPVEEMRTIYARLGLGDFEEIRPRLEEYLQDHADYQRNRHALSPAIREEIDRRWSGYMARFGYAPSRG